MEQAWQKLLQRDSSAHKYDFGHVLIIGGSDGMEGAPMLGAEAAMRIGAGLVTIASTHDVVERIAGEIPEVMTFAAISEATDASCQRIVDFIERRHVSAVTIGSGMAEKWHEFLRQCMKNIAQPMVIDAGALRALSDRPADISEIVQRNSGCIFTPHSGEFADLIAKDEANIDDAEDFAEKYHTTIVLKGNPTFVASSGAMYENQTNTPALATAGTGDVLAGMIAGVVAQGVAPAEAAQMAVYVHGLAGERAAMQFTEPGVMAHDVIAAIPEVLRTLA